MNDDIALKNLMIGKTIPEQRKIAKVFGVEYKTPSITAQIISKGKIEGKRRGTAKELRPHIVIPEIYLQNDTTIPGFYCDPRMARAAGMELLRIADEENL